MCGSVFAKIGVGLICLLVNGCEIAAIEKRVFSVGEKKSLNVYPLSSTAAAAKRALSIRVLYSKKSLLPGYAKLIFKLKSGAKLAFEWSDLLSSYRNTGCTRAMVEHYSKNKGLVCDGSIQMEQVLAVRLELRGLGVQEITSWDSRFLAPSVHEVTLTFSEVM